MRLAPISAEWLTVDEGPGIPGGFAAVGEVNGIKLTWTASTDTGSGVLK